MEATTQAMTNEAAFEVIGSYLSRHFERQLVAHFLRIELLVGLVGGLMPAALFALHVRYVVEGIEREAGSWEAGS